MRRGPAAAVAAVVVAVVALVLWTVSGPGADDPARHPERTGSAPVPYGAGDPATGGAATPGRAQRPVAPAAPGAPAAAPTPTVPETARGPVTVRVLGPDGAAVAGAIVLTLVPENRAMEPTVKRTGADGRAAFDDLELSGAEAFLVHVGDTLAAIVARPEAGAAEVEARLVPAIRVRGRVERTNGEPLPGSRCRLLPPGDDDLPEAAALAESGDDGVVEFLPIPRPGAPLSVRAEVVRAGLEPVTVLAEVTPAGTFVVRPPEPRTVRGRAVDPEGRPLAGVAVRGGPHESRTDADGRFRWVGPPPTLTAVLFDAPDRAPVQVPLAANDADADLGDVVLAPGEELRGTATDASGRALPHFDVTASAADEGRWAEWWHRRGFAAADGTFVVRGLPPGERVIVRATVAAPGGGRPSRPMTAAAGETGLRLVVPGALAVLRFVRDADGVDLAAEWGSVGVTSVHPPRYTEFSSGGSPIRSFTVRLPEPGRAVLNCRIDTGEGVWSAEGVAVVAAEAAAADVEVRMRLLPGTTVRRR